MNGSIELSKSCDPPEPDLGNLGLLVQDAGGGT